MRRQNSLLAAADERAQLWHTLTIAKILDHAVAHLRGYMTSPFRMNSHVWRMQRESRSLRVYVVEPREYAPIGHASIFNGALSSLLGSEPVEASLGGIGLTQSPQKFDLLTFPEAFLPSQDLVSAITLLSGAGPTGCIHTGLRPSVGDRFLFTIDEAKKLIEDIGLAGAKADDLQSFEFWLDEQPENSYFNLGAVIAIDADCTPRVCLHSKMVRSKFELSALSEANMVEGNLLSVVTLESSEPKLQSYTLQPLLCSDALTHETDRPGGRPIDALTAYGNDFSPRISDYVDIVSLATCTPHPEAGAFPRWHTEFREAFLRTAKDDSALRHRHALFFLANFCDIPRLRPGGLSGAFLPVELRHADLPEYVLAAIYGTTAPTADAAWYSLGGAFDQSYAHMICLKPSDSEVRPAATMLGFDLHRILRERNQYHPAEGLLKFERRFGFADQDGTIIFTRDRNEH